MNGKNSFHVFYASLMLGFVFLLNISAALLIFESVTEVAVINFVLAAPRVLVIVGSAAYFVLHYSYFRFRDRYKHVVREHGGEIGQLEPHHAKVILVYVVSSFPLLVALLYLLPAAG